MLFPITFRLSDSGIRFVIMPNGEQKLRGFVLGQALNCSANGPRKRKPWAVIAHALLLTCSLVQPFPRKPSLKPTSSCLCCMRGQNVSSHCGCQIGRKQTHTRRHRELIVHAKITAQMYWQPSSTPFPLPPLGHSLHSSSTFTHCLYDHWTRVDGTALGENHN